MAIMMNRNITPIPSYLITKVSVPVAFPDYERDIETIAYHEAGHALMFRYFRIPITEASINKSDISGKVTNRLEPSNEPKKDSKLLDLLMKPIALNFATVCEAGIQAELLFHDIEPAGLLQPKTSDTEKSLSLLWKAFNHRCPLYYCQRLAREILQQNWPIVEAIATSLMKNETIDEQTINNLINTIEVQENV